MRLKVLLSTALLAGLLAGSAWLAQDAQANFAASPGFSGRAGATCLACHIVEPVLHEDAHAVLEGLPAAWELGQTYHLTIRVEGGPPAMPAPQPQGGLDLSIDGGTFSVPADFEGLLYTPNPQEITYRPQGTLMREWKADWTAPDLATRPHDLTTWLSVLAADGNHVIAANASDGGERFDSVASLVVPLPMAPSALATWMALPLSAPTAQATVNNGVVQVSGRHTDGNATDVAWSLDGGAWQSRATGTDWQVRFEGLSAGAHRLAYRSSGSDRTSAEQSLSFDVRGFAIPLKGKDSPSLGSPAVLVVLALALVLRRTRP